jgi:hypothetical protein
MAFWPAKNLAITDLRRYDANNSARPRRIHYTESRRQKPGNTLPTNQAASHYRRKKCLPKQFNKEMNQPRLVASLACTASPNPSTIFNSFSTELSHCTPFRTSGATFFFLLLLYFSSLRLFALSRFLRLNSNRNC